jgi:hypothetical protein
VDRRNRFFSLRRRLASSRRLFEASVGLVFRRRFGFSAA